MDLSDLKLRPDLPYSTEEEQTVFRELRRKGVLSFFRIALCEVCQKEIPKTKQFCSVVCWKEKHGGGENEDGGEGEVD